MIPKRIDLTDEEEAILDKIWEEMGEEPDDDAPPHSSGDGDTEDTADEGK